MSQMSGRHVVCHGQMSAQKGATHVVSFSSVATCWHEVAQDDLECKHFSFLIAHKSDLLVYSFLFKIMCCFFPDDDHF